MDPSKENQRCFAGSLIAKQLMGGRRKEPADIWQNDLIQFRIERRRELAETFADLCT